MPKIALAAGVIAVVVCSAVGVTSGFGALTKSDMQIRVVVGDFI